MSAKTCFVLGVRLVAVFFLLLWLSNAVLILGMEIDAPPGRFHLSMLSTPASIAAGTLFICVGLMVAAPAIGRWLYGDQNEQADRPQQGEPAAVTSPPVDLFRLGLRLLGLVALLMAVRPLVMGYMEYLHVEIGLLHNAELLTAAALVAAGIFLLHLAKTPKRKGESYEQSELPPAA